MGEQVTASEVLKDIEEVPIVLESLRRGLTRAQNWVCGKP